MLHQFRIVISRVLLAEQFIVTLFSFLKKDSRKNILNLYSNSERYSRPNRMCISEKSDIILFENVQVQKEKSETGNPGSFAILAS